MPVKDWLPAAVRAAAIERTLKSGEALFRLGDKTAGLCEVVAGRVRLVRAHGAGACARTRRNRLERQDRGLGR